METAKACETLFLEQKPNQSIFSAHVSVEPWPFLLAKRRILEASWNVMAHAQKPDFVFRRNGPSPFKSAGASVQSTIGSRGVRISGSNAGYTMVRGSVKGTGYPLHSPHVRHRVPSHFNWSLPRTKTGIVVVLYTLILWCLQRRRKINYPEKNGTQYCQQQ